MSFLPIVARELGVAARRSGTYWVRFFIALVAMVVWLCVVFGSQRSLPPYRIGQILVNALSILGLGFCLLAGVFFTADCLSEEKRNGTLGLLFLTDLKGFDVVLGKLAATSLNAIYGLLALFPIMGLSLLLGGVTASEFGRITLVLLATLCLSLTLGMLISALSHDARLAMLGTFLAMLFIAGLLPLLWWLQYLLLNPKWSATGLLLPSPGYALLMAFDPYYNTLAGPYLFWASFGTILALGLGCFGLSCRLLPHTWQGAASSVRPRFWHSHWRQWRFGNAQRQITLRTQELEHRPFYWLMVRDRMPNLLAWITLGLVLPIWSIFLIGSVTSTNRNKPLFIVCFLTAYALHQVMKMLVALEATRPFNEDRQSGAWELLWITPIYRPAIPAGVRQAMHRQFGKPLLALVVTNLSLCGATLLFPKPLSMSWNDQSVFLVLFIGGMLMLVFDYWALTWVGMAMGLRPMRHHRAVLATVGRVMLIPWLALFVIIFIGMNSRALTENTIRTIFILWFIFGSLVDAWSGFSAQRQLHREFRAGC